MTDSPGRGGPRPTAALVSYPKSGRTWLRFMLAHYLRELPANAHLPPIDLQTMFRVIPNAGDHPQKGADAVWVPGEEPTPAIVAAHGANWLSRELPTVLLLRDPAEVLVSHYHHEHSHRPTGRFVGSFDEFLASERGIARLSRFLASAAARLDDRELLVVDYDALKADTGETVRRTLRHVGVERIDSTQLGVSVAAGSFESMARMEAESRIGDAAYDYTDRDARRIRVGAADRGRSLVDDRLRVELVGALRSQIGPDAAQALRGLVPDDWSL